MPGSIGDIARNAARFAVHSVLVDYYATPQHWSIPRALERLLRATNAWLLSENTCRPDLKGLVVSLSVLIVKDHRCYIAHAGNTRIYRFRNRRLRPLTRDHAWSPQGIPNILKRAIGLDDCLVVDYREDELQPGDLFVLVSDGAWEVLGEQRLLELVRDGGPPQDMAVRLVEAAQLHQARYMGRNDVSALVAAFQAPLAHASADRLAGSTA